MRDASDIQAPAGALDACVAQIREAAERGLALRVRGGDTKRQIAAAGRTAAAELDLRVLSGITHYEPSELVLTALAGTPLVEIESALAECRQSLPFEPPRLAPGGTLGGMVASGLAGPSRVAVGSVRDHVLGVAMLDGRGRLLRFGGEVMKNVAGYDVSRLLAGSWGRLGALAQVSLKVLPTAPAEATLSFAFDEADALEALARWNSQPLPLNASWWQQESEDAGEPRLNVRLRGAAAAVEAACQALGGARLDAAQAAVAWAGLRDQRLPWFAQRQPHEALWRVSVPPTAAPLSLPYPGLIEWHGGLRWLRAPDGAGHAIGEAARAAGGHASLFIASEKALTPATGPVGEESPALAARAALEQRLCQVFDPHGVFSRPGAGGPA